MVEPVVPSPKFHAYEYGAVPPDTVAVKVTDWPVLGAAGMKLKSAVKASGVTVTEWVADAVFAAASVPVTVTVNVPLTE